MSDFELNADGWLSDVRRVQSPNCDERPAGVEPELLIIHAISLPPEQFGGPGVEQLFTNTLDPAEHEYYESIHKLRVSAHFFIRRDGEVLQFVAANRRAWHAGVSSWAGRERCNDFSIGIELEGSDRQGFEARQYTRLVALIHCLARHFPVRAVLGHNHVAPGRKTDPGPFFDWQSLSALLAEDKLELPPTGLFLPSRGS